MRNHSIPFVVAMAAIAGALFTACDDNETRRAPLQPSGISSTLFPSEFAATVRTSPVVRRPVADSLCPFRDLFSIPLEIHVESTSQSTVFLNRVGFQFIDSFGVAGRHMTADRRDLERRFGRVGLPPRTSRAFPFAVELGCGTLPHGRIDVSIQTIDARLAPAERSLTVFVR